LFFERNTFPLDRNAAIFQGEGIYIFCEEVINNPFGNGKNWKIYEILIVCDSNHL